MGCRTCPYTSSFRNTTPGWTVRLCKKSSRRFIEAVIERLDQKGVAHEFLKSEWQAINSLDAEEKEFCKAAAILGLDPLDIDPEEAARIAEVWNKSDPLTREEGIPVCGYRIP